LFLDFRVSGEGGKIWKSRKESVREGNVWKMGGTFFVGGRE
jgi:hypothetical protein